MLVGRGIDNLFRGAMPASEANEENVARMRSLFVPYYNEHGCDWTRPYDGIMDILEVLKEDGLYQGAKDLWSVLKNAFELSEKPSSLYELSVKEEDMYYGMLLEVLYGMMQQDLNAAIYGGIQYGNDLMKTITECFQMVYDTDG